MGEGVIIKQAPGPWRKDRIVTLLQNQQHRLRFESSARKQPVARAETLLEACCPYTDLPPESQKSPRGRGLCLQLSKPLHNNNHSIKSAPRAYKINEETHTMPREGKETNTGGTSSHRKGIQVKEIRTCVLSPRG